MTEEQKLECERWAQIYEGRAEDFKKLHLRYENKVRQLEDSINSQIAQFEKKNGFKLMSISYIPGGEMPVSGKTVNLISSAKMHYYSSLACAKEYRELRPLHRV